MSANLETCCSAGRVAKVEVMLWCVEWQEVGDVSKIVLTSKSDYLSFYILCPSLLISLLNLLSPYSRDVLEIPTSSQVPKFISHFMETDGSPPCSQHTFTCSYPDPDQSSPSAHPYHWKSILILSSTKSHVTLPLLTSYQRSVQSEVI
jgi:hypothetical protein